MKIMDTLLAQLPDLAERTKAQLVELNEAPSEVRAELMAMQLEGAARHVRRIQDEMRREKA